MIAQTDLGVGKVGLFGTSFPLKSQSPLYVKKKDEKFYNSNLRSRVFASCHSFYFPEKAVGIAKLLQITPL